MAELAQGLQLNISNLIVYCKVKQEMIIQNVPEKEQKTILSKFKQTVNHSD